MGIMASNSDAHVLLLFALARIGVIMVPVNPEFGAAEARYVLAHAGVSAVVCSLATLKVAAHKVPRFVVFVDKLPHTPTHKVAKHLLKGDRTLRAKATDFQAV